MQAPSAEQAAVIQSVREGRSVVVDAVAGSGKTTTVLGIARAVPGQRILQITYNSQLKNEVRAKVAALGIENLEVHTYHSLVVRFYDPKGYDDARMRKALHRQPRRDIPAWDIIVVDEAQDETPLYFALVAKLLRDRAATIAPQIVVLGDRYQGLYEFKGADTRFLTLAKRLYPYAPGRGEWRSHRLQTSYRATHQIAWYVNRVMVGAPRMVAVRDGPPVEVMVMNPFTAAPILCEQILCMMAREGIRPGDIFVLAPSLRTRCPPKSLENLLVAAGVPVFFPTGDDRSLDGEVIDGKVVFSTFHQSKGRERDVVIVYGWDASYFKYYARNLPTDECPATLYVAATRAKRRLVLLQNETEAPLPFLKMGLVPAEASGNVRSWGRIRRGTKAADAAGKMGAGAGAGASDGCDHLTTATDITRFLGEAAIGNLSAMMDGMFETIAKPRAVPETDVIPGKIIGRAGMEDVADLNGLAIVAMYESQKTGEAPGLLGDVRHSYPAERFLREAIAAIPAAPEQPGDYLYLANVYLAVADQVHFRLAQIPAYDWMSGQMAERCLRVLDSWVGEGSGHVFEAPLNTRGESFLTPYGTVQLHGRADIVDDETLYEIKCVSALQLEHLLQLVVYAFLWQRFVEPGSGPRVFRILNVLSGEVRELRASPEQIEEVVQMLVENKYRQQGRSTDAEFLEQAAAAWSSCTKGAV